MMARINTTLLESMGNIEPELLRQLYDFKTNEEQSFRNGYFRANEIPTELSDAFEMDKEIDIIGGAYFGSPGEKASIRKREESIIKLIGLPHLFITITPNAHFAMQVLINDGKIDPQQLETFSITDVFGWDRINHCATDNGNLISIIYP